MPEVLRLPVMVPYYSHRQAPDLALEQPGKPTPSYGSRAAKWQKCAFDQLENTFWFGGRKCRWPQKRPERFVLMPQLTLENVKMFLVHYHGSLKKAFDYMDFIKNGTISPMEWSESVWGMIRSKRGHEMDQYNFTELPRKQFDAMMTKIFRTIDFDRSGEITFDELSRAHDEVFNNPHMFTEQRAKEKEASMMKPSEKNKGDDDNQSLGASTTNLAGRGEANTIDDALLTDEERNLRDFTAILLSKYENFDAAFRQLDNNNNGDLSQGEFQAACVRIRFDGDWREIFKYLLGENDRSYLVKSDFKVLVRPPKRLIDAAKKASDDFKNYSKFNVERAEMAPNALLPRHVIQRRNDPTLDKDLGTFSRLPCRRLDNLFHPSEIPGTDPQNFEKSMGPGRYLLPSDEDFAAYLEKEKNMSAAEKKKKKVSRKGKQLGGAQASFMEEVEPLSPTTAGGASPLDSDVDSPTLSLGRSPSVGKKNQVWNKYF
ncbi:unnamed protein product [Amoebophrya sp. A25]|nr:unnamed protein product [Amoebophrya sp. A25]|eukprot:GSA25T00008826001.1